MVNLKLILCLLAFITISLSEESSVDNYIFGGRTARPNQFPFLVSLRTLQNVHFCGAAILNDRWLLSVAHCTQGDRALARNIISVFGAHHRENDGFALRIDTIIAHPEFYRPLLQNDICVIRTAQWISFVPGRIQPIRLPITDLTENGSVRGWMAGWGVYRNPNELTPLLQFNEAYTISRNECRQRMVQSNRHTLIIDRMLCTLTPIGVGTCRGDSGGPLVNDLGVCLGLASWNAGCGHETPDVYTRIWPYLRFIHENTGVRPQ